MTIFRRSSWSLLGLLTLVFCTLALSSCDTPIGDELKNTGSILVTYSPDDADVSVEAIDDEGEAQAAQGLAPQQTSSSLHYLKPPGDYLVTVEKEGYQTQTRTVSLEASEVVSLIINLDKDGEGPTDPPEPPEPGDTSEYTSEPGLDIDEDNEVVSDSIQIEDEGFVTNLEVMLDISHEWVGDLVVELEHAESGNLITLVEVPRSGLDNVVLTLSDAAELDIQNDVIRGVSDDEAFPEDSYTPFEPLRFAYGTALAGEWTLTVTDVFPRLDDGKLNSWSMKVTYQGEQPDPALAIAPLRGLSKTLAQGFTETSEVKIRRLAGLTGPVTVELEDSGSGVNAPTVTLPEGEDVAGLRVEVSPSAATSERDISLVAQSGEVSDSYTFTADVVKPKSKDVELLAHMPLADLGEVGGSGNDSWGWTDPETGKDYALVGTSGGTAFVDISAPTAPVYLGSLPTHTDPSSWRDIKVYKNHAFIVSEARGHGMQVFDLSQLRSAKGVTEFSETAHYGDFGNAHNIAINEATGFAYAVGATETDGFPKVCDGGLFMIDINTPTSPSFAGCFAGGVPEGKEPGDAYPTDVYVHDAQCVIYNGPDEAYRGREICITSDGQINEESEDYVAVVDVTDKANPVQLSRATYRDDTEGYSHQGWLTEDHAYFLFNDELDETGDDGTLSYIWDVSDLNDIKVMDTFRNPVDAIGHNVYIKDGFAYQANYTSGLRVLDAHHIGDTGLEEIAYFDTYPDDDNDDTPGDLQALSSSSCAQSNARASQLRRHPEGRESCGLAIFSGAWNNYPFFESGVVVLSDIDRGLFLLKPTLHDHP